MCEAFLYLGGTAALVASLYIAFGIWLFWRDLPRLNQGDE